MAIKIEFHSIFIRHTILPLSDLVSVPFAGEAVAAETSLPASDGENAFFISSNTRFAPRFIALTLKRLDFWKKKCVSLSIDAL